MSEVHRPLPAPTDLTRFFWEGTREHRLMIQRCQSCRHYIHYPQPICPRCASVDLAPEAVSGTATVYSFTEVTQAFHPFFAARLPYLLAIVELSEQAGLRMLTELVDCSSDEISIGLPVVVKYVPVCGDTTLPCFRPAASS